MKEALYACIHADEFPAQALLRLRHDLKRAPVAVLNGRYPQETVCSFNHHALRCGVSRGMTRLEGESIQELVLLSRSTQSEVAASAVMLECAAAFSPRIEEASRGIARSFVLDIAGSERLFGQPYQLAERLRASLATAGFRVSIAVSANYEVARMKAEATRGITIIPHREEAAALAGIPVSALDLDHEHLETLAIWGIRTLGEFATLPEHELVSRLGANASLWRDLACGSAAHIFHPIEPAFSLWEYCEFETPVENMESLLFVAVRMIESMAARATGRALCIASLAVCMRLDGGREHHGAIKPALPTADRKFLLKLLQLEITAHPPSAAVVALTLTAEVGQSSKVQLGLFSPQTPEPSRLDVTLARLKAIVGEDRVGSPVLEDTHRSDGFHLEKFSSDIKTSIPLRTRLNMALRRIRPPIHVQVVLHAMRPSSFRERSNSFKITAAYGAWRTTGCWWSMDRLDIEEWDILAAGNDGSSIVGLLIHDLTKNQWWLEALYD